MEILAGFLVFVAIILIFAASQLFWVRRVRDLGRRWVSNAKYQKGLGAAAVIAYLLLVAYNFAWPDRGTRLTFQALLLEAPFGWWLFGSIFGFGVVVLFWIADRLVRAAGEGYRKLKRKSGSRSVAVEAATSGQGGHRNPDAPVSPERRRFLEQTALAVSSAPFVAGVYGLLYGRLNLETSHHYIKLSRLPRAFHGLRLAQLSDIHIGPFMAAQEIRKYVAIANELRADLIVLTGDYVTWEPDTQRDVVKALAGLKAPFGVFGCLGNHEIYTDTEDSIARLFAAQDIRILRNERAPVQVRGETLNLIGVDFQSIRGTRSRGGHIVPQYLPGVETLVMPDTANILLSHNPNSFDRAARIGIDLSLAGHTHGGQVNLEFIHPSLSPSRLITPYVAGWFEKSGAQLYVNRGIGTIGVPIRFGSPPEITVFELRRA